MWEAFHPVNKAAYYFSYSTPSDAGFRIDYMTSSNHISGFKYCGTIPGNPWPNNNNHASVVEFKSQWYIFYHNRAVSNARGASSCQRSYVWTGLTNRS
jgi:arabinoxylan arabinofuranohydrolase